MDYSKHIEIVNDFALLLGYVVIVFVVWVYFKDTRG
jgi:hypothetical protein